MVVGVLTGLFGAGGGFIITPALNIFLGLPMNLAVGTSSCQVLGSASFALWHHRDKRLKGVKLALIMAIGIPPGAFIGAECVKTFQGLPPIRFHGIEVNAVNFILLIVFAFFLTIIAAWLFFDNFWLRRHHHDDDESEHRGVLASLAIPPMVKCETIPAGDFSIPLLAALGLFMGFLSGLLGIGGGVIMMPMLFYLVGQETKYATSTSMMLILISGLFATIVHSVNDNIDYILVGFLMFSAFFGTRIGAVIQRSVSGKSLRKHFAFVVLAAAVMVVVKLFLICRNAGD